MIVGRGLLANAFAKDFSDCSQWVIFASGVSNSSDASQEDFDRERTLLESWLGRSGTRLVYFSSCGLAGGDAIGSPYMRHKQRMESLALQAEGTIVLRLPQVVGKIGNPHTLMNYLHRKIASGEHFEVWSRAERNVIDVDDVALIGRELLRDSRLESMVINIAAEQSSPMINIVKAMEFALGKKGNYAQVAKGLPLRIDSSLAVMVADRLGINLRDDYLERTIAKYYGAMKMGGGTAPFVQSRPWVRRECVADNSGADEK